MAALVNTVVDLQVLQKTVNSWLGERILDSQGFYSMDSVSRALQHLEFMESMSIA
jgi:hypothetical protein